MKFKTVESNANGLFKDKGSRFLSFVFPIQTPEQAMSEIEALKKKHPKARHHCFAYLITWPQPGFRTYDDGEPSGTAGLPILNQIKSHGLTNICIVVVRYFGGKLLGVSGLANAYKESANDAIQRATLNEVEVMQTYRLISHYDQMGEVMEILKRSGVNIVKKIFGERAEIYFELPLEKSGIQLKKLKSKLSRSHGGKLPEGVQVEQIEPNDL